jgi:hypothetical protein
MSAAPPTPPTTPPAIAPALLLEEEEEVSEEEVFDDVDVGADFGLRVDVPRVSDVEVDVEVDAGVDAGVDAAEPGAVDSAPPGQVEISLMTLPRCDFIRTSTRCRINIKSTVGLRSLISCILEEAGLQLIHTVKGR